MKTTAWTGQNCTAPYSYESWSDFSLNPFSSWFRRPPSTGGALLSFFVINQFINLVIIFLNAI